MSTFCIITLGCKVNQYESGRIRAQLLRSGFQEVPFGKGCDIFILNTCSVTRIADKKSRQKIRQALKFNPHAQVIVTGCAVENNSSGIQDIAPSLQIVPLRDKDRIPGIISCKPLQESSPAVFHPGLRTRALLKIQDGCNHFCTYCIVPYLRGAPRSTAMEEIMEEAEKLASEGYREIVLTGIHLGAYGIDLYGSRKLAEVLVRLAEKVPGVRIRMSSIEPHDFNGTLLRTLKEYPCICPHIHLPLQHASSSVLSRMGRGYTIEEYREIVASVHRELPEAAITSDVIVGFPGETEEDFRMLLDFLDEAGFYRVHVFKYSPRAGTRAAQFKDRVSEKEKSRRSALAIEKGLEKMREFCSRFIGKTRDVLVEEVEGDVLSGLTENYLEVFFKGPRRLKGEIVPVRLERCEETGLWGELSAEC